MARTCCGGVPVLERAGSPVLEMWYLIDEDAYMSVGSWLPLS